MAGAARHGLCRGLWREVIDILRGLRLPGTLLFETLKQTRDGISENDSDKKAPVGGYISKSKTAHCHWALARGQRNWLGAPARPQGARGRGLQKVSGFVFFTAQG